MSRGHWRAWTVALWAWLTPGLAAATPQEGTPSAESSAELFRHRMTRASALHEALDYEKALNWLGQAKQVASTSQEQVEVELYRGIVLADMGRRKQSMEAFRVALSLRPDAQLPVPVAPKVTRDFESVRKQVKRNPVAPPVEEAPKVVATPPPEEKPAATAAAPEPKAEPETKKDLRTRLGEAGSGLKKNVGSALGTALDTVMGSREEPPPAAPSAEETR
ncbi:tetratricopeptide repeat protein [Myxococcus stipitatus]|uniref:tetratricopeptide repeat protein n=1 Tax=Myxococcus stipitatus TaxID=83455 RepID=UPI003144E59A